MPLLTRDRGLAAAVFLAALLLALAPIRSYDYFWHLATGQWILDHRALPATDPFALASDSVPWINGEWLFQTVLAAFNAAGGAWAIVGIRAILVASLFAAIAGAVARQASAALALPLVFVAFYGAEHRLGARPETIATMILAAAVVLALRRPWTWRIVAAYSALAILWINIHPSALLAPAIAAIAAIGIRVANGSAPDGRQRIAGIALSAFALLANPHGLAGVTAPLHLARAATGDFVNLEWLPSSPGTFPLLYVTMALALVAFARNRAWSRSTAELLLFGFFAVLAARFVRNQGFYFVTLPLLLAPVLPQQLTPRLRKLAVAATAISALLVGASRGVPLRRGPVDRSLFPVAAVDALRSLPLRGGIYNPDQLGGFLIWSFYPERRVLTDGRNELHRTYIEEYGRARNDSRLWNALLARYGITAAVEEYRSEPLEVIDARTGTKRRIAPSLAYFPRTRWALVAFDDAAMVLVDRTRVPAALLAAKEYRWLVPDGEGAGTLVAGAERSGIARELLRADRESGGAEVVQRIARAASAPR